MVAVVALVEVSVSVDEPPAVMDEGLAARVQVGAGVAAATVTDRDAVTLPAEFVALST